MVDSAEEYVIKEDLPERKTSVKWITASSTRSWRASQKMNFVRYLKWTHFCCHGGKAGTSNNLCFWDESNKLSIGCHWCGTSCFVWECRQKTQHWLSSGRCLDNFLVPVICHVPQWLNEPMLVALFILWIWGADYQDPWTSVRQSDDKRPPSKATQRRDGVSRRRAWARRAIFSTKNKNSCHGEDAYFQYQKEKQFLTNLREGCG